MVYLGLGDDAEYDDGYDDGYDEGYDEQPERAGGRPAQDQPHQPHQPHRPQPASNVTTVAQSPAPHEPAGIAVRPVGARPDAPRGSGQTVSPSGLGVPRPRPQVVRPIAVTANAKPHVVVPSSFNQAQDVADKFKSNQPVIMNLQDGDRELSRRLIDFASGLCYGLGGQMERLTAQVYLLIPANVEVSADERQKLRERGYDS